MSLTQIKTELYTLEVAITGVNRAYEKLPNQAPEPPDLPAIINERGSPFLDMEPISVAVMRYNWNFDILFLLSVAGMGDVDEWDEQFEVYPRRMIETFLAHLTLNGNAVDQRLRTNAQVGVRIKYLDTLYFGFVLPWTVSEDIVTAVVP